MTYAEASAMPALAYAKTSMHWLGRRVASSFSENDCLSTCTGNLLEEPRTNVTGNNRNSIEGITKLDEVSRSRAINC
jgi:hypothetical protein